MRHSFFWLLVLSLLPQAHADVTSELARMLDKHPEADADRDGTLSEDEAGKYFLKVFQRKRPNRGTGIRDRSLIDVYETRTHKKMPYRLMSPLKAEPGQRYPLIISLHGSGGIGDDNRSNLRVWNGVMARQQWREKHPSYVLVPQRRPGGIWGKKPDDERVADYYIRNDLVTVLDLIEQLKREFPIDDSRIYAIGASGGGMGTWNIVMARPEMFAAAIPVCSRFSMAGDDAANLAHIPIWSFHGDEDQLIDVDYSRRAFAALTSAGGRMKYTELRGVKHNAWIQAFNYQGDDEAKGYLTKCSSGDCDETPDTWEWLFRQHKGKRSGKD